MPVRVMLVDDQQIVVSGLRAMLQVEHDIAIVGEALGVKEAIKKATELRRMSSLWM